MTALAWIRLNPRAAGALALVAALLAAALGLYLKGRHDAHARNEARQRIAVAQAQKLDAKAARTSEADLAQAAEVIIAKHKDLEDAVARIPDTVPDAVAVAAGCRELQQHGVSTADLSVCRPAAR